MRLQNPNDAERFNFYQGCAMQKPDTIDFAKLLGFDTVVRDLSEDLDFQNETLGAKLGAKVGDVIEPVAPEGR